MYRVTTADDAVVYLELRQTILQVRETTNTRMMTHIHRKKLQRIHMVSLTQNCCAMFYSENGGLPV